MRLTQTSPTSPAPARLQAATVDAAKLQSIPCPNLRTLVNEGLLTPDANGLVRLDQLDRALQRIGIEGIPKKIVDGAQTATKATVEAAFGDLAKTTFNVFKLSGTTLDHAGDTRILRNGFNKERLDWLVSFADKNGRLGSKELGAAQKEARNDEATGFVGKALGVTELAALLRVYGTKDSAGNKSLSVDGVRSLYEHARFPDEWRQNLVAGPSGAAPVNPQKTGLIALVGAVVQMAYQQIGTAAGRGRLGADLALSRDPQLNQTSAMGLANAICPAGPPTAMPKAEADKSHAAQQASK